MGSRVGDELPGGWSFGTFCLCVLIMNSSAGAEGIADQYPDDVGIGRDARVLFHDDFETGVIGSAWSEVNLRPVRGRTDQTEPIEIESRSEIARGQRSARVQLRREGHEDVTLVRKFSPGYDQLHMRHYVRYGRDYGYHGHGGSGFMADAGQGGFKGAGKAPDGDKFFWLFNSGEKGMAVSPEKLPTVTSSSGPLWNRLGRDNGNRREP